MRTRTLLTTLFCAFLASAFGQKIEYKLEMQQPQNHYFQVEMTIENIKDETISIKMPVWSPGSYLVREFAKNVDQVHATDENGKSLSVKKTNKNTWQIEKRKAKKVKINYEVYAFELSVRTSFLDLTHGFVSGSGVFMYLDKYKKVGGDLTVVPYKDFKIVTTALPSVKAAKAGSFQYTFKDYDQLVDCPLEIGNQTVFTFVSAGVNHTVAMYGVGNYDIETLKTDMAKITDEATKVFGQNPNKDYTFIIHNVENGQGGLEHVNSTTLSVNRWTYQGSAYLGFISLVAHEYFHLWNVKRIRPIELGPFNYDEENYTTLLWVMEGFTSYYDELLLLRAGFYNKDMYLSKLNNTLNYVEGSLGSRVQPLADASYDAWIKAYRPNENSSNTTMTYYSRGALMAAIFDAMIVDKFQGKKSLDEFMQELYDVYFLKQDRGFTETEFKKELEKFLEADLSDFFNRCIYGTEIPDYEKYFSKVGMTVEKKTVTETSLGARYSDNGGKTIVRSVRRGSAAETGGLSANDEIIAVNEFRIDADELTQIMNGLDEKDEVTLLISRDNLMKELPMKVASYSYPKFILSIDPTNSQSKLLDYWLR